VSELAITHHSVNLAIEFEMFYVGHWSYELKKLTYMFPPIIYNSSVF